MSAGTPIRTVRLDDQLWRAIKDQVAQRNIFSRSQPWTMSDFIAIALQEKLDKMRRCREHPGRRKRRSQSIPKILSI